MVVFALCILLQRFYKAKNCHKVEEYCHNLRYVAMRGAAADCCFAVLMNLAYCIEYDRHTTSMMPV